MKKKYNYPIDNEIVRKLIDPNYDRNRILQANASELDKAKYKFCQEIISFQIDHKLSNEEVIERMKIDNETFKNLSLRHIEKFTLDDLISYSENLASVFKMNIFTNL